MFRFLSLDTNSKPLSSRGYKTSYFLQSQNCQGDKTRNVFPSLLRTHLGASRGEIVGAEWGGSRRVFFVCLFLLRCLFLLSLELGLEPQDSGGEIVGAECGGSRRVTIAGHQLFSTQDKYDIILRASPISKQNWKLPICWRKICLEPIGIRWKRLMTTSSKKREQNPQKG